MVSYRNETLGAAESAASAGRLAHSVSRLGEVRRFAMRRDDERLLQSRGATVHNARADDRVTLELLRQGSQEGVALEGMDRRGCGLNGVHLVVG